MKVLSRYSKYPSKTDPEPALPGNNFHNIDSTHNLFTLQQGDQVLLRRNAISLHRHDQTDYLALVQNKRQPVSQTW